MESIMSQWIECTLNDIGEIVGGSTPLTAKKEYYGGEIPWITPKDLSSHQNRYIAKGERNITKAGLNSCSATLLPKNTILFTSRAPIGYVAISSTELCTNQGFKSIIPKEEVDNLFVYYLLVYNRNKIISMGSGTTFKEVSGKVMKSIEVKIPQTFRHQKKIASILGRIDDKIELNNKINDNLQQQAATLFANFYEQAETEVGFTELVQILGGGTPKTGEKSYWNGKVLFFTPKDIGFPYTLSTEKTITEEGLAHCNSRLYPVNTVFVTARGTVGKIGMPGVPMAMNQSCYALIGKNTNQILVYFYTLKVVDRLKYKASGAVFDAITTRDFETESIFKLSDAHAEAFLNIARPIYRAILGNTFENQQLTALRDFLLPKLISGELDVSELAI